MGGEAVGRGSASEAQGAAEEEVGIVVALTKRNKGNASMLRAFARSMGHSLIASRVPGRSRCATIAYNTYNPSAAKVGKIERDESAFGRHTHMIMM